MDTKRISAVSGAALLALTATASAGPMSVANPKLIAPPLTQTDPAAYRYSHHHGHYGWYHHRYRHYGWRHHRYHHRYYGWNPGAPVAAAAVGLLSLPWAVATGGYYGYYGGPYYYGRHHYYYH